METYQPSFNEINVRPFRPADIPKYALPCNQVTQRAACKDQEGDASEDIEERDAILLLNHRLRDNLSTGSGRGSFWFALTDCGGVFCHCCCLSANSRRRGRKKESGERRRGNVVAAVIQKVYGGDELVVKKVVSYYFSLGSLVLRHYSILQLLTQYSTTLGP
jgi:hypothetical protein